MKRVRRFSCGEEEVNQAIPRTLLDAVAYSLHADADGGTLAAPVAGRILATGQGVQAMLKSFGGAGIASFGVQSAARNSAGRSDAFPACRLCMQSL